MTRPLPAPHSIAVPHRGQLPFQQLANERAGRVGSDAKKCTRVTPIYPKGGAHKKSECTYGLRSSKTTIVPIIAASVAMPNAVLFFQLLMSPGHTMDSNTAIDSNADQSVARGHCGVFVVRDFLRKSDVLMVTRIEGKGPSAIAKALKIGRASVYRALAGWREDQQAPIGFAVRGSSHRKGFFRHSLGKGKNSGSATTMLSGGSQHPAGL